jgi:hypothetical protein
MEKALPHHVSIKNAARKTSIWLAGLGFLCFSVCLILPAIRVIVLGRSSDFLGFHAALWAVGIGVGTVGNLISKHSFEEVKFVFLGFAGLMNVAFLVAPVILMPVLRGRKLLRCLAALSVVGLVLGIFSPFMLTGNGFAVRIGYFVWLLGYVALFSSAMIALREAE